MDVKVVLRSVDGAPPERRVVKRNAQRAAEEVEAARGREKGKEDGVEGAVTEAVVMAEEDGVRMGVRGREGCHTPYILPLEKGGLMAATVGEEEKECVVGGGGGGGGGSGGRGGDDGASESGDGLCGEGAVSISISNSTPPDAVGKAYHVRVDGGGKDFDDEMESGRILAKVSIGGRV